MIDRRTVIAVLLFTLMCSIGLVTAGEVAPENSPAWMNYKSSCEGGNLDDCNRVGTFFIGQRLQRGSQDGDGIQHDITEAIRYFQKACEGGSAIGCYQQAFAMDTGTLHLAPGDAAKQDDLAKQASALYEKSCDMKYAAACDSLAGEYAGGVNGRPKNASKAHRLGKKARKLFESECKAGNSESCARAGFLLASGRYGVKIAPKRAEELYQVACKAGVPYSCGPLPKPER